ncbi:MAG: DUF4328 domain-containing protein [Deltaproteobacteria bacterium]|nr:DUF4328 domain-containing protein [Deltaproteobacteria bacterium]MDE0035905.1 DUF4328 domain-containing protein [Deltaproteobacteria bacterium]
MHDSQDDRTPAAPSAVFRNPTSRANQARGFLCVSVFAALYGIQHHARAYRSFPETGESLTSPELWGFRFLLGLAALTTAVAVSRWIHRANSNARALGARGMAFTPGGAVGWYFVPIANLWKPYQAMREIWKASAGPLGWQRRSVSALLPCWWLLAIVGPSTAGWVTWAAGKGMDGIDENAAEHMGEAVSLGVLIPASVLLVMIISRVHNMQMTHYRRQRSAGTLSRTGSLSGRVPDQG